MRRNPDEVPPAGRYDIFLTYRIRKITSSHSTIITETRGNFDFLSVSVFFSTFYQFLRHISDITGHGMTETDRKSLATLGRAEFQFGVAVLPGLACQRLRGGVLRLPPGPPVSA